MSQRTRRLTSILVVLFIALAGTFALPASPASAEVRQIRAVHRLYNPFSGEHFFTPSADEGNGLIRAGWTYEGTAWWVPDSSDMTPVQRLYNPFSGEHFYSADQTEVDNLRQAGWTYEGVMWNNIGAATTLGDGTTEDGSTMVVAPVYRLYNPNDPGPGAHHYTLSVDEATNLTAAGWKFEGAPFHAVVAL